MIMSDNFYLSPMCVEKNYNYHAKKKLDVSAFVVKNNYSFTYTFI